MKRFIQVCEFRARNIKENKLVMIQLEKVGNLYYYITFSGHRGKEYKSLVAAKEDIKQSYNKWHDFKMLI